MTSRERLRRQATGQEVDRPPTLGGWIGGARNLAELAGISLEQYLADPFRGMVRAHVQLGIDGMVQPVVPTAADQVRTGNVLEERFLGVEPEALLDHANAIPDSEREVLAGFESARVEAEYRGHFQKAHEQWEGIVPIPNFWDLGGHFPLYQQFGYVAFLSACALYPDAVGKIWWARSLVSREKAKILARLYRELDLVPLMFCGEDLCNNQGPMVDPQFLRRHYFPSVGMIIQSLVEEGIRVVHHCDGDIRPVVDDFLSTGFSGLQGFQFEVGIDPYELRSKRSAAGEELLFFTGMSVTGTLPFGSPQDVRDEVEWFHDWTDGGRGMFLFTTNVTGVEVPVENIRAGYGHVQSLAGRAPASGRRPWPWDCAAGRVAVAE
jgi:hypothetical protein